MRAFITFNKGLMKMPVYWQPWLLLLVALNLVVPLVFFADRLEAQVVMGSLLVSMTLMTVLTARVGFTRLVGLGHIVWVPLLYFLSSRLGEIPADNLFGVWVRALIAVNAVSLLLDAVDVIRYVAGDRAETVAGLSERAQQA